MGRPSRVGSVGEQIFSAFCLSLTRLSLIRENFQRRKNILFRHRKRKQYPSSDFEDDDDICEGEEATEISVGDVDVVVDGGGVVGVGELGLCKPGESRLGVRNVSSWGTLPCGDSERLEPADTLSGPKRHAPAPIWAPGKLRLLLDEVLPHDLGRIDSMYRDA